MMLVPHQLVEPRSLSALDAEMEKIFKSVNVPDDVKAKLYQDVLARFLNAKEYKLIKSKKIQTCNLDNIPLSSLMKTIPIKKRVAAELLYEFLQDNKEQFHFNQRKELVLNGQDIPGSNFGELFHYTVRDYTKPPPIGWEAWKNELLSKNVPPGAIGNIYFFDGPPKTQAKPHGTPSTEVKSQQGEGLPWCSLYK